MSVAIPVAPAVAERGRHKPFVGPEALQRATGKLFAARLGANESMFGPSPAALAAMRAAASDVWMYGDPENHDLITRLAAHHNLPTDRFVVGEGIDGLLSNIAQMSVTPGLPVVTSDGAYPTFNEHIALRGGVLHKVPYRELHEDLEGLREAVRLAHARIVYITNPDNPMGTWWEAAGIQRFVETVPEDVLVLLDEAYCDTAPVEAVPDVSAGRGLAARANVVRLRTFSKAYGLAGARVGYAIAHPDVAALIETARNDYGVNRLGQIGACAAIADQPHLAQVVANINAARHQLGVIAAANDLSVVPSATNFVAIDCGRDAKFAERVLAQLQNAGIFVRKPTAPGLDRFVRVSVGTDDALATFATALPKALSAATLSS